MFQNKIVPGVLSRGYCLRRFVPAIWDASIAGDREAQQFDMLGKDGWADWWCGLAKAASNTDADISASPNHWASSVPEVLSRRSWALSQALTPSEVKCV